MTTTATLRQVVLDAEDARALAEFYRRLLGLAYRHGDEPPAEPADDVRGRDWLVLLAPAGAGLAVQQVDRLERATWPSTDVPQQLHLDCSVPSRAALEACHVRALELGATVLQDRSADPDEPLFVYADPEGHPFCVFVHAG